MVDYYKLLEVSANASEQEIQAAIKKMRRLWNNRSTNPNADIRAEAEQYVRNIAQAEKILLDSNERKNYDEALSQQNNNSFVTENMPTGDGNANSAWLDRAKIYMDQENYPALAALAQDVLCDYPKDADAWYILGEASYYLGKMAEAEKYYWQAFELNHSENVLESLGFLYGQNNQLEEAYRCFSEATRLDPKESRFQYDCAEALRLMDKLQEALELVEKVYGPETDSTYGRLIYFSVLHDVIYQAISYNRSSGKFLITNKRQLDFVKQNLPKLSRMVDKSKEAQVKAEEELRAMVIAAEQKTGFFSKPGYVRNYEISNDDVRRSGLQ